MDADRRETLARVASEADQLAATIRDERDRRRDTGQDTTWMDQILPELDQLATDTHDIEITEAIRQVLERHGPGPYPDRDLAALAGVDIDRFRRVRDQLVAAGLARPADEPPGSGQQL
ncbi:hypothetical protein ACFWPH_28555 [Nocardia sp. NPDC058499]|uniref:hypothetical protein n=1 Tax=Nocardia sp. NPDC058499 TaxID=3346530 RepID=UPI00365E0A1A